MAEPQTLEMELRIQQRRDPNLLGHQRALSRLFSRRNLFLRTHRPILNKVGIAWSVVANLMHLARSCADFPLVLGRGGENCDVPNSADHGHPAQGATSYQRFP